MTIELSLVPASPDGNCLELIPRDVTGMPDIDRLRHLQEGAESSYTSLFAFGRQPVKKSNAGDIMRSPEYPSGGVFPEDLEPLRNFQSGVYALINTRSKSQGRLSVFAGMAGIDKSAAENFWGRTDVDLERAHADSCLGLVECLEKQSVEPPSVMKTWDLVIVIPTQRGTDEHFRKMCQMMAESKEIFARHKLPNSIDLRNKIANSNVQNYSLMDLSGIPFDWFGYLLNFIFSLIAKIGVRVLVAILMRILLESLGKEKFVPPTLLDQSIRIEVNFAENHYHIQNINFNFFGDRNI